ncbi:unnamed protein product (macronuclear) [Paramecium tetraurelia]|uniref:PH domain-containing protein n=1 Tax=Paramecium tetraurelia TaxID=5888 RepID=A0CNP6_PARTE|nr:uncharacterized protein GSPATT00008855001 [Paramecium tetraurelia]CAK72413.1 unnamed protein product [Paramecium tetraurelia]|eukprot:XP_001439810.1 hypothetical protein (macronuclear) [Paramecium tetraurelia strain d4-2]
MLNSKKLIKQNQLTELNNFLLQVKQAFITDDFEFANEPEKIIDNKFPLQEIIENTIPQIKQDQIKQATLQPQDDIQNLLSGLTTLLEKNLQESHNLYQIFQSNKQFNSKCQDSNSSFQYQKEENIEALQEDIKLNEIKLLQMQNSRLLNKIESLNEQIAQFESDLHENSKDYRQLVSLINSTYCIQRIQYMVQQNTITILGKGNDEEIEQGVFVIVDDQIILSPSYLDENKMILDISQILDVTYKNDFQIIIHYNEGKLILIMENQQDFAKIDLSLWSTMRRNACLNSDKLFENSLFERPFRQEINIDFKKLKEQLFNIIPQMEQESKQQQQQQQYQQQQQQQFTLNIKGSDHFTEVHQSSNIQVQSQQSPELKGTQPKQLIQVNQQTKLQHALLQLKQGFCMIKYSEGQRKPNIKIIYLTENEQYIKWKDELQPFDQKNTSEQKSIQISQIKEVKDKAQGSGFEKFKKYRQGKESLGITIIAKRNLELDAPKQEIKDLFLDCLKILLDNKQNNKFELKSKK